VAVRFVTRRSGIVDRRPIAAHGASSTDHSDQSCTARAQPGGRVVAPGACWRGVLAGSWRRGRDGRVGAG
jgi:hypothetical protein